MTDQSPATRSKPLFLLPFWAWIVALAIGGVIAVQVAFPDQGMANGSTWMILLGAAFIIFNWFCFFSDNPGHVRLEGLLGGLAMVALFLVLFRVEGMTGNMIPIIVWRFSSPPSPRDVTPAAGAEVDLAKTTPHDYPRFLGPNGDLSVTSVQLARDWAKTPPQELWRIQIDAGWSGFAVVNGYALTQEQRDGAEMVTCYELETGKLCWSRSAPSHYDTFIAGAGPRATPTIHQGKVYTLSAVGLLRCLDGKDGQPIWEQNLLDEIGLSIGDDQGLVAFGRSNSPLIAGDLVIVPLGGAQGKRWSLAAFHKDTGKLAWKGGDRNIGYSSPVHASLAGVPQVLCVNEDNVSGHDVTTGKVLWELDWPGNSTRDSNVSQAVPLAPDRVYISKGYGGGSTLVQLKPKAEGTFDVKELWRDKRAMKTKFTNVTILDGHVYGLSDGILECQNLETGKSIWRDGRYGHGQILRVGDLLLVLSEEGELFLVEATPERADSVLGQIQVLPGRTWNNLALSGPYLLVRNGREAACYRLPVVE